MNRNNYILSFVYLIFLFLGNQTYSQTYNPSGENTTQYTTDQTTNHFFYKAVGNNSIDINVSLNKLQFTDNNNVTYGWNGTNAIPSNWDFEILTDLSNCPTCVVSADKKKITYSGPENETIAVKLRIFDKNLSGNPTIANSNSMGSADITYRIISRFTTISKKFNSLNEANSAIEIVKQQGIEEYNVVKSSQNDFTFNYEYKVDLGVYYEGVPDKLQTVFDAIGGIEEYAEGQGVKYMTASKSSYDEVLKDLNSCKEKGIAVAKIVAYKDGVSINVQTILNQSE